MRPTKRDVSCAACVRTDKKSGLAGLGVDVAKVEDFQAERVLQVMSRRLLANEECGLLQRINSSVRPRMLAVMFSVREAAIKSIADQVRYYEDGGTVIRGTDMTDFMVTANGSGRIGTTSRGEAALQRIGVRRIETAWAWVR